MALKEIHVPDIGDFSDVPVIELHVKPGDVVAIDDPIATLESDKATMDVPAPEAGVVKEIKVAIGDKVSQGALLITLEASGASAAAEGVASRPSADSVAGGGARRGRRACRSGRARRRSGRI